MLDVLNALTPALRSMPIWVTVCVTLISLATVAYMRARGASLAEHVSIAKSTQAQVAGLVQINEALNKQIQLLIEVDRQKDELINALRLQILQLEQKVDQLAYELKVKEARNV